MPCQHEGVQAGCMKIVQGRADPEGVDNGLDGIVRPCLWMFPAHTDHRCSMPLISAVRSRMILAGDLNSRIAAL